MGDESAHKSSAPGRRRPRGRVRVCLFVLLGLVGLVLLSMVVDRLLPAMGVRLDRPTRFALPPNLTVRKRQFEFEYTLKTNPLGLRHAGMPSEKPAGVQRIVILGDAQTAGIGVEAEQTFAALLENRLPKAEIINCGRPQANLLRQARMLYRAGLDYDPDAALMCVSADDLPRMPAKKIEDLFQLESPRRDLADLLWPNLAGAWAAARQRSRYTCQAEPHDFVERVAKKARRKNIAESEIQIWKKNISRFPDLVEAADKHRFDGNVMASALLWRPRWHDSLDLDGWHWDTKWKRTREVLAALATETSDLRIRFAVLFVPARMQYDREHLEFLRGLGYHMTDSWLTEKSRLQIALGRWCGDRGIPFVDVTSAFRTHASPAELSYRYGGELTAEGHKLIARQLALLFTTQP